MKKVLKKFNRTLSIMLAAAMVLTMVPQTAMPVLAAEGDQIEAQAETDPEVDTPADESDDESADVGKGTDKETSDVSDTTEGETNPEEEDTSDEVPDDNDTPVIDPAEDVEEDPVEEPAEAELPNEAEDDEVEESGNKTLSVVPNALIPADLTVEAVEPDTSDNAAEGATVALTSAEIVYTNGCVSKDGKLRKDADITFKLVPKAGKKLGTVQYKTKGTAEGATESAAQSVSSDGDGTYTIAKSNLMHDATVDGKTEKVNDVNVTIIVPTTDIEYTLKAGTTTGYKLYLTKADTTDATKTIADTAKEIASEGLADKITYAKKGDDVSFAVVAEDGTATKIRSVEVQAGDGEAKTLTSTANTADTKPAPIYTFKPSDLAGMAENDNQDITITVTSTASAAITIDKTSGVGDGATIATVADAAEVYETGAFVDAGSASSATEGQKVIFTVTMDEDYKELAAGDVTATLGTESIDVTPVAAQTKGEGDAAKTVPAHYMIDLAKAAEDATLTIKISTDLKDTANQVKFESVSENSIITEAAPKTAVLNGKTVKVKGNTYSFDVKAKPGYKIYAIGASYTKKYTAQEGETTPADVKVENEGLATDTLKEGDDGAPVGAVTLSGVAVAFSGTETIEGKTWTWTTASVEVKVNAKMDEVTGEGKTVTFNSEYDYEVKAGDKVVAGDVDDTYTVKAGAELFEFTVDAEAEPTVTAEDGSRNSILLGEPTKAETGGWVYQIAAGALADDQTITIARKTFDITVDYDHTNVIAEVYDHTDYENALSADSTSDSTDTYNTQTADYAYKFIIEPENDNTKISKVSYTVGDSEEAEEVKAKGDSYVFYVDLTDDVHVTVETKDEYDLVVKEGATAVTPDKSGVYNVGHASTVTAQLLKGTEKMPLFNADVKDGSAVAATIARISGNVVTLEFDSTEYNKVLTVELTLNDKARTVKTFKVKTTAAAAEVSLAGVKNNKVEIPVDTKASYKLTVKTKNASMTGLAAKVVPADDTKKADNEAIKAAENAVSAVIDEETNSLVITAKPAKTGAADVAKVIIVDESGLTNEQKAALNVDNALKGGVVTVTTKDATIVGKNPTVKLVSTTDKAVKVQLGVPKEVVNPEVGKIFYKVELTVPQSPTFPEGTTDAAKAAITAALAKAATDWNGNNNNLYQAKAALDAEGGLLEIPVMAFADGVAADLQKGVLMGGFSVNVTLVQTTTENGLPYVAETTIEGGNATLENIATKNPYYEVKLGLKKGTTNLITGQNKDIVVATPTFNKLTSYSSVAVEFVDTSSGKVISSGSADGYAAGYCGMYTKYDELSNAVIVNAKGATYGNNANGYYKNLGVKVTAYAEDSAYGAVATQKLTVVNGIQSINPDAPIEIYKADNKAASFTVTTDLNKVSLNKNYAPKAKKLNYEIVAVTGDAADLTPNLKANVAVAKNGKVTINKNYVVAPKAAQNQFKVKVSAADYADSNVVAYTDPITITDEGLQMGEIAVFDVNTGKLVAAASGSIEATVDEGEYQVAVLAPGVKTTKKTYDLDTDGYSSDIINPALLTFKSSNAKSVGVDPDGALTVLKAAKNVKITAVPKDGSNPKPVKTLTVTVGQVSTSPLLKITRYEDSTLGTETVLHEGGATTINYNGNSTNNYFKLDIMKAVTDNGSTRYEPFYLANYSISYKGAKQISKTAGSNGDSLTIVANAADAVITLKDKTNKSAAAVVYTLHNNDFVSDKNAKAPKIATTTKMTQGTFADYVYYTVKGGKTDDFTDKYVMLSVDRTKKNPTDIAGVFSDNGDSYLDKPLPILMGAGFNLYVNTRCDSGNYNLVATVGSLTDGVFKPEYKDAKVTVKIAKAKAASLSATGNYTLSLKANSGAYIKYKSGNGWVIFTNEADDNDNYAKNAIINGQENHFTDYFEVKEDYNGSMYVALKDLPLTAPDNNKDAPALDKIADDANKNDRIGYISINNGSKFIDVKLTIAIKDYTKDKTKYKVTATPVLDGPKAVTALTILEGKADVDVAAMMAVSEVGFTPIYDRYGNCYLEAANLVAGNHKVDLYIVPWNAPQAYRDAITNASGDAAKREAYEKYGIKTSITVKATDKATTKNKVAVVNKGSNKWTVTDTDYNAPTGWSKYTPFSFKNKLSVAETTDIAIAATVNGTAVDYVTFDLANKKYMAYETVETQRCIVLPANYPMEIKLDKAKLVAAIAADAANTEIAASKKLDWGKTVKVKATFSYGTDGPVADELTFDIKLPANAGAADQAVTDALETAESRLQSNIETYTKGLVDANSRYLANPNNVLVRTRINSSVEAYIRNEVNKAIQGASVTVAVTNNGTQTTQGDQGEVTTVQVATEWTVVVTSTAAGTPKLYDHTFAIPGESAVDTIETAIKNLNLGGANNTEIKDGENLIRKVTAKTTAAEFAAAVRKILGAAATRNISITAAIIGDTNEPAVGKEGSITFQLTVKDLSKVPSDKNYSKVLDEISYTLPELDDLAACKNKITAGLTDAVISTIVNDAKKAAPTGLDAKVQEMLVAKANTFIVNNDNITVKGIAKESDSPIFSLVPPQTAAVDSNAKIYFTLELQDTTTGATHEAADLLLAFGSAGSEKSLGACDAFQSLDELKAAITAFNKVTIPADGNLPTETEVVSVVQAELQKLKTGVDLTNTITAAAETEGDDATTYTKDADGKVTAVAKLKVTISGVDDPIVISTIAIEKAAASS